MTYARTLVTRWTRRDWLAIAVVALAVAFLVGTSITVLATSATVTGGSFGGYTPDRRRLYVPGLEPDETARVRVATTIGRVGFGVPIDGPVSSVE